MWAVYSHRVERGIFVGYRVFGGSTPSRSAYTVSTAGGSIALAGRLLVIIGLICVLHGFSLAGVDPIKKGFASSVAFF